MNFENDNVSYYANKMHSENNYSVCSSYGQNYIVVTQTPAPLSFVRARVKFWLTAMLQLNSYIWLCWSGILSGSLYVGV